VKLAVMLYSFASLLDAEAMTVPSAIELARELGIDAIEIMDRFVQDESIPAIVAALAKTRTRVICYDVEGDFARTASRGRVEAIERVQRGFERAARLGAPQVLLVPGPRPVGMSPEAARDNYVEGVRACLPAATRLGLTVSLENLGGQALVCGTSDHLLEIVDRVGPDLKLTFDAGNFLLAGEDALKALSRLWSRVVHVHLKDWQVVPSGGPPGPGVYRGVDGRGYTGAALGDGSVDLPGVLSRLGAWNYPGFVSIEYEGTAAPREAVKRGIAYLRDVESRQ
jgi:sugar phosphate isomerase/epimerase